MSSRLGAADAVKNKVIFSLPWSDWRAFLVACLAGYSAFDPDFVLRNGAVLSGAILLSLNLQVKLKAADIFLVFLTAWTALSLVWSVDPNISELALRNQLAVLVIFLCVRSVVSNLKQLEIIASGFIAGCLYALYQLLTQNHGATLSVQLTAARLETVGLNVNYMAYSLTTGLALIVLLWHIHRARRRLPFFLIPITPLIYFGMVQTGTRGALLGAIMILLWIGARRVSPGIGLAIPVVTLAVGAIASFTGWGDGLLRQLDSASVRSTGDLAGRLTIWPYVRQSISLHPFFGIGAGGSESLNSAGIGAHNVPLEIASGLGLIGLAFFIGATYCALIAETRNVEPAPRSLLVGVMIVATTPIILSGHWELSPAAWIALALFSRIVVLSPTSSQTYRHLRLNRPRIHSVKPMATHE